MSLYISIQTGAYTYTFTCNTDMIITLFADMGTLHGKITVA